MIQTDKPLSSCEETNAIDPEILEALDGEKADLEAGWEPLSPSSPATASRISPEKRQAGPP